MSVDQKEQADLKRKKRTRIKLEFKTDKTYHQSSAFLPQDAPRYKTGYTICISFVSLSALSCIVYFVSVFIQNRNRDRNPTDQRLTEYEKTEMGDLSPDYRYLL